MDALDGQERRVWELLIQTPDGMTVGEIARTILIRPGQVENILLRIENTGRTLMMDPDTGQVQPYMNTPSAA